MSAALGGTSRRPTGSSPFPPARSLPNPTLDSLLTLKSNYKKAYRFYPGARTGITPAFTEMKPAKRCEPLKVQIAAKYQQFLKSLCNNQLEEIVGKLNL